MCRLFVGDGNFFLFLGGFFFIGSKQMSNEL